MQSVYTKCFYRCVFLSRLHQLFQIVHPPPDTLMGEVQEKLSDLGLRLKARYLPGKQSVLNLGFASWRFWEIEMLHLSSIPR